MSVIEQRLLVRQHKQGEIMNNFNLSSTGYNVELTIFFDCGISRFEFEENFKLVSCDSFSLLNDRYRGVNIYAYQLPDFDLFDLDNWAIPSKSKLYDLILNELFNGCTGTFNTETRDQFSKYSYQLTKLELLEFLADTYEPDYQDFIIKHFEPKFTVVSSRGHCQGDYVEVIYFKEDYNGNENLDFDNEIWNAPIYARFTVNDEEFYIDEHLKDPYNYDEDEIEAIIEELINDSNIEDKQLVINEVISLLPASYPEYQ